MKKALAIGGASVALLLGGIGVVSVSTDDPPRQAEAPRLAEASNDSVDGEVIVTYKDGVTPIEAAGVAESISATTTSSLDEGSVTGATTELVELPDGTSTDEAIVELSADPNVESVEPNYILSAAAVSDDPEYLSGGLWGVYGDTTTPGNPYGSQAGEVWEAGDTGSSSVVIGVIDEGIQFTHPDLVNNIWTNPADPVDAVDNDGNGFVDDIHGWDFENNDNSIYDGLFDDHGTHVAGTIGAEGGNAQGVAGVNWDVSIINGRFLGSSGFGTLADAISAINYMTDLKANHGVNIVATSNSWGCLACPSVALQNAIIAGGDEDILFVAAAGNDGVDSDVTPFYPAGYTCPANSIASGAYDCIIAVAAIDDTGGLASFSNYGSSTVDIGAPGVSIESTVPLNAYAYYNGTSMATPHVAGAVALTSSVTPALSASALKSVVLSNAATTASLVNTVTGGRLDLSFLAGLPTPPPTGSVTVCHATETEADMGNGHTGLFLSFTKEFVDRGTAGEALHAGHRYDYMWLSTGSAAPCPTPGNGLGDGGFVSFVN